MISSLPLVRWELEVQATDVREVLETILPEDALMEAVRSSGLQSRERKLEATKLLRAMVIAASTGYGGRQADVMRLYLESGAEQVVRGGFYRWFGPALEAVMETVRDRALAYVARQHRDLPGWLGEYVDDWIIIDSSTVKLDGRLKSVYPGAGDYAALKVHKRFSVGVGTAIDYHISPAREHDSPHLRIDESWSGLGLLADLGYASLGLLRDCEHHAVKYVIRLKESWKPKVESLSRGTLTRTFTRGTDLDVLLDEGTLLLAGEPVDAEVSVGQEARIPARLVAVSTPKGYCFYLTNLPAKVTPEQVAELYRVRWEIESDNKLDKSCLNLDEIGARTGPAVRAMVHASMVGSVIVGLLAHHHRMGETRPAKPGTERTSAPIHPQTLARAVGCAANSLAAVFELKGQEAAQRWTELAGYLTHLGRDPNWRRRPSVLDQLRGWRISAGRPRKVKTASHATIGPN